MTAEELRIVLAAWVANAGGQKRLAAKLDVSEQYLCDVLKGRREPGKKLLDGIGAERVVTYRMKDTSGVPPSDSKTEAAGGAEQTNTEMPDLAAPLAEAASDVKADARDDTPDVRDPGFGVSSPFNACCFKPQCEALLADAERWRTLCRNFGNERDESTPGKQHDIRITLNADGCEVLNADGSLNCVFGGRVRAAPLL